MTPATMGRSQMHRRLKKIEDDRRLKAAVVQDSCIGAREILMARINAIGESYDAARARGEEVPTADPEVVKDMLRRRFGWPNESLGPAKASRLG
jgi:hypothetical protein